MKRFLLSLAVMASLVLTSCSDPFDDSSIWEKLDEYGETLKDHEQRISELEELCKQMNTNISSLQAIVAALQNNDYVTAVVPVIKDGVTIGYTITFSKSQPITIYHGQDGKDGADGKDGYTPQIGVKQDTDGIYYWTLDGEWLLDESGNKIKAVGTDGKDGQDGSNGNNGQNGTDGKDGITPQLKIEDDYWYISYDNGASWTQLGKATGEDGKDGQDGQSGDSFFQSVTQDEECVYFTLADGTVIALPKYKAEAVGENCKIYYTTSDGKKLFPKTDASLYGAILVSNTYKDGQGVLTFDDTITSIGDEAFLGCTLLSSITIPDSVTSIGNYTFCNCEMLTTITITESVTSIGEYAFCGCSSLISVTIPDSITEIENSTFDNCTSLTSVTIPDGVTSIGEYAFRSCRSLTSATIGNSVTSIGDGAFAYCNSLTSVTIPDSVTLIGYGAFYGCTALKEVYCKPTTTPIGADIMFLYRDEVSTFNNYIGCTIYVPAASVGTYKNAQYWKDYTDYIIGYDFEKGEVVEEAPIIMQIPYEETFKDGLGLFTINDVLLGEGLSYVWKHESGNYGSYAKASAFSGGSAKIAESMLVSPMIDLSTATAPVVSFEHCHKFAGTPSEELTLWVKEASAAEWAQVTIPTYGTNTNWTFVTATVDLSAYAGKQIQIAFKYVSTASHAGTWEVRNFKVAEN